MVRPDAPGVPATALVTNMRGEFSLPLPAGVYTVTIAAAGFADSEQRVTIGAAKERVLEVMLTLAGFSETVQVDARAGYGARVIATATKTPTPLRDVPQSVSVVTRELMADQRMASMAEVVRFMPGVSMAQGEGNRDTPILRGNSSTSNFFIDGVRDDVQYLRDVYNLERVEGLKGPNAMIFGHGGGGGVINRVTRQSQWAPSRELALQFGSWDNRRITADFGDALSPGVAARVTGVYEKSDSYRSGVGVERYGVQPSVAFRLGPDTTLRASYEYFHDDRTADRGIPSFNSRPVGVEANTFFGDPDLSTVGVNVNLLASVLERRFGNGMVLRNRVSYGVYDKFYQNVFPGAVTAGGTTVTISGYNNQTDRRNLFNQIDVMLTPRTGGIAHTVLVGAEVGRQVTDNFRSTGHFPSAGPTATSIQVPVAAPVVDLPVDFRQSASDADNHGIASTAAVYAQDQVALTSQLQALAGVRFDLFDVDFTNNRTGGQFSTTDRLISPRLGLVYKPIVPVSLYGSYSLTYVPRAGDQLSSLSLSNQALEPEEFRNYEVGIKWDVTPALGATAAVYRLDRGNVAVPDAADPTRLVLVDAQRTKGFEVELNGAVTDAWTLIAGYAYQDGTITRSISAGAQEGSTLGQVPAHSLSMWSKYDVSPRWSAAVGVLRRSAMFAATDNLVVLPGFTRVDGAVFFDVTPHLRAQANLENLFDTDYHASAHNNNNIMPGSPRAIRFAISSRF
jgi:catecholate siderophore receptor